MVDGSWNPAGGRVAASAIGAEPGGMRVGFYMTGNASRWCPLEGVIQMTVVAGNIDMFPG